MCSGNTTSSNSDKVARNISVGDVVKSLSGRTKGRYFVVIAENDRYVFLSDGEKWTIGKSKKKNRKHVEGVGLKVERISDEEIKRFLRDLSRGGNG
ncbi:MAG TPA: KOW domain-containing RNA-binding protein [Coprothermobacter proteolyticus]|nr:KOW domain-containing RNA-binding protein [Coprothermobacter proteolyticus]